jgi:DNA-binding IclR family transcriptional regulator
LAVAETGAPRAAVQRNLDVLVARGLAREVTGQGRYRVWTTAL